MLKRNHIRKIVDIGVLDQRRIIAVYFSDMSLPDDKGFSFILNALLPPTVVFGLLVFEYSCVKVTKGLDAKWEEVGLYIQSKSVPVNMILLDQRRQEAVAV